MYDLRIVAILTANDDGSQAATPSTAAIAQSVKIANQIYNPHGVNFLFDPATDIYRFNDDLLNRDCKRRDHKIYTNKDVDPANGPEFDGNVYNDRRNEVARRFPGRIAVFFTAGSRYKWENEEGRWVYGPRTYSWSNGSDEFVTMASWAVGNDTLAHELGHYLHLHHTFAHTPESIEAAVELIRNHVDVHNQPKDTVLNALFEGDGVADTPPDPGPTIFKNQCDPAETSVSIPVKFADGSEQVYTLSPDRENIMNYWDKTCRGGVPRITSGQANKVLSALQGGNRGHLIDPVVLYFGIWGERDKSQTRALSWGLDDFAKRFNEELSANRRCVHMQAYDIGGGQIRYDGVWEKGIGTQQTRALSWALDDFAKRFNEELGANRRCVHMQAYDIGGGQIRYDGVWESGGNKNQARALGWALGDFAKRFNEELSANRRCVHMQAYDIGGGQIRYDGVWEQGTGTQQTRALSWALDDFAKRFNEELSANRRCTHMQAYDIGGGQIRYDGVWESGGNKNQTRALSWGFNDFITRCDQEASAGQRLVHMQAYDMGGGQLRYDGVWEKTTGKQQRVLALPLGPFADHFDEWTSADHHITFMSACLRIYAAPQQLLHREIQPMRVSRRVFFGSDIDKQPASMEPLPSEPLTARGTGCDLGEPKRRSH
jgi:hypothetical protein